MQEQDSSQTNHEPSSVPLKPLKQGKGKLILVLGLLSLFGLPVLLSSSFILSKMFGEEFFLSKAFVVAAMISWPLTFVLSLIALVTGYRELSRIGRGITEPSKRKSASAGMWLGGLGSIILSLGGVVFLSMTSGVHLSADRDTMISDLNYLFANAYQYRVRAGSAEGGKAAYTGYTIPTSLTSNENGIYTAVVLHTDTVQFHAISSRYTNATITVKIGPDGRAVGLWIYTGDFE